MSKALSKEISALMNFSVNSDIVIQSSLSIYLAFHYHEHKEVFLHYHFYLSHEMNDTDRQAF